MDNSDKSEEKIQSIGIYGDLQRTTRIFYAFAFTLMIASITGILIVLSNNDSMNAVFLSIIIIPVLISLYLIRHQRFESAATLLSISVLTILTLVSTNGLGIHHLANFGFPTILIVASMVMNKKTMAFITLYAVGCAGWLVFGEISGLYTPHVLEKSITGDFFTVTLILITTAVFVRFLTEALFNSNQELSRELEERKLAEEKIARLNQELEHRVAERTAELEESNRELESFSYSVSHDLRAPLRAIHGFSTILQDEHSANLNAEAGEYLDRIRENAYQMDQLIDDLLLFSRLGRHEVSKEAVEPYQIVSQILESLSLEIDERGVDVVIAEDLPICQADPILLKQVYFNLLDNAMKYTRNREKPRIEIGWELYQDEPVYFVKDNGIGFNMKYADKLFDVFQRLHSSDSFEGTGVGLAIVKRIIQRHGGKIWVEAEEDKGANFRFTFNAS